MCWSVFCMLSVYTGWSFRTSFIRLTVTFSSLSPLLTLLLQVSKHEDEKSKKLVLKRSTPFKLEPSHILSQLLANSSLPLSSEKKKKKKTFLAQIIEINFWGFGPVELAKSG
mmetsp:Transcript_5610/g.7751  ORF Transcript_5610/g.7751 Transcript_5610/m.7751 type:complete len:112 (+) Transcript_5610:2629-2964(+)